MNDIDKEIEFVTQVVTHPAGYDLDLFGMLCICPTDQLVWEVSWEVILDGQTIKSYLNFPSAYDAAKFFVAKRHEMQLGEDFEEALFKAKKI